jgi:hypothetical protein
MNSRNGSRPWLRLSAAILGAGFAAGASQGCFLFNQCMDEMTMAGGGGGEVASPPVADSRRAIVEADIVQIVDNRLYALSSTAGLNVIDLSDPGELPLLDQADVTVGQPFEMYVREGTVVTISDAAEGSHISSVQTFDVSDPTGQGIAVLAVSGCARLLLLPRPGETLAEEGREARWQSLPR